MSQRPFQRTLSKKTRHARLGQSAELQSIVVLHGKLHVKTAILIRKSKSSESARLCDRATRPEIQDRQAQVASVVVRGRALPVCQALTANPASAPQDS